jgi:hypothetical protein
VGPCLKEKKRKEGRKEGEKKRKNEILKRN